MKRAWEMIKNAMNFINQTGGVNPAVGSIESNNHLITMKTYFLLSHKL